MKFRFASALLALTLPICAQEPAADAAAEGMFYKAFYLEKGQRAHADAMVLYEQFLEKAPDHKLAKEAARLQFSLLNRTGKAKERDAFKEKYKDLLGDIADAPTRGQGEEGERGGRGQRGERGEGRGFGGRGGMRGMMELMRGDSKIADMDEEGVKQLKEGIDGASRMIDRMRERNPEVAEKLDKASADLKKALDAGKTEEAQKALDAVRAEFGKMRGGRGGQRGQRGDEGGGAGGEGRRRRREGGGAGGGGGGDRPAGGGGGN